MPGFKPTLQEYAKGTLRSGSKKGPKVTNPKQALAIAYSEAGENRAQRPKHSASKGETMIHNALQAQKKAKGKRR